MGGGIKCPLASDYLNKLCFIQVTDYSSAAKREKIDLYGLRHTNDRKMSVTYCWVKKIKDSNMDYE